MNTLTTTKTVATHKAARCPECGAYAELFLTGEYAGIWACTNAECMASDGCKHLTTHTERTTVYVYDNWTKGFEPSEEILNICNVCEQPTEDL